MKNKKLTDGVIRSTSAVLMVLLLACASQQPMGSAEQVKEKLLGGTDIWDIDLNDNEASDAVDLWFQHADKQNRYLVPKNGTQLGIVNKAFHAISFSDIQAAKLTNRKMSVSDRAPELEKGTVFALRSSDGNYAKVEITGFEPLIKKDGQKIGKYSLKLRYVLYRN